MQYCVVSGPVLRLETTSSRTGSTRTVTRNTDELHPTVTVVPVGLPEDDSLYSNPVSPSRARNASSGEVIEADIPQGETTGNSISISSATELNLGFLESSQEVPEAAQRLAVPKPNSPRYAHAPGLREVTPPHPLLSTLNSSDEFQTPTTSVKGKSNDGSTSSPESQPEISTFTKRKACRNIMLLSVSSTDLPGIDDLDPEPLTPTPETVSNPVLEVHDGSSALYLMESEKGKITVPIIDVKPPSPVTVSNPDLASTSRGMRNLQTKMKDREARLRIRSASEAYPSAKVSQAKNTREQNERASSESTPKRQKMPPRGPGGRFLKKKTSATTNDPNLVGEGSSSNQNHPTKR